MSSKNPYNEFQIRRSQLITPFGIGSLVNVNNLSLMISDSEYWKKSNCDIFHDIRLEKVMGADGFIEPPIEENGWINYEEFPKWYFSPADHSLRTLDRWKNLARNRNFDREPYDKRYGKKAELVPVRIVCVCSNGHVQDFPWIEWVHRCNDDRNDDHELKLYSRGKSGEIRDLVIECKTCEQKLGHPVRRDLGSIFSNNFAKALEDIDVSCNGDYFWKKNTTNDDCDKPLKAILKNATNFYFPNISASVNIPFRESKTIENIKNDKNYENLKNIIKSNPMSKEDAKKNFKFLFDQIAKSVNKPYDEIADLILNITTNNDEDDESDDSIMDYRRAEFEVLTGKRDFDRDSGRLNIKQYDNNELIKNEFNYSDFISSIVLVKQLEVVNVLRSFSRVQATDTDLMREEKMIENDEDQYEEEAKEVSLRRNDDLYVGMRFLGEGIFIPFNADKINFWLETIEDSDIVKNIYNKNVRFPDDKKYLKPSYYMLHTFAHILIKELSDSCGYSSSSLNERLYFSDESGSEMYGILIYTSSSDSEGTMGGLVKQGIPSNLSQIISSAIEKARWCSFDPICIESNAQGRDSLNAAACHACALISETSCEKMNSFLDRRMLVGSLEDSTLGFFS